MSSGACYATTAFVTPNGKRPVCAGLFLFILMNASNYRKLPQKR
jgi:hypothetical protein